MATTKTAASVKTAAAKKLATATKTAGFNAVGESNPSAERRMTAADRKARIQRMAKLMFNSELRILIDEVDTRKHSHGGRALWRLAQTGEVFTVHTSHDGVETGLEISAYLANELYDSGLVIRRAINGADQLLHAWEDTAGFNNPSRNYGLPGAMKVSDLKPGAMLTVRFLDTEEDEPAILISRDSIDRKNKSGYEYSAKVLSRDADGDWTARSIGWHQIMMHNGMVKTFRD